MLYVCLCIVHFFFFLSTVFGLQNKMFSSVKVCTPCRILIHRPDIRDLMQINTFLTTFQTVLGYPVSCIYVKCVHFIALEVILFMTEELKSLKQSKAANWSPFKLIVGDFFSILMCKSLAFTKRGLATQANTPHIIVPNLSVVSIHKQ